MSKNKHFEIEIVGDRKTVCKLTDKNAINLVKCPTDYVEKKNLQCMLTQLLADTDVMKDDCLYLLRYDKYDQAEDLPDYMKQTISIVPVHYVREVNS